MNDYSPIDGNPFNCKKVLSDPKSVDSQSE
jgi:hypothetical protein